MIRNKYFWITGASDGFYFVRKRWAKIEVARIRGGAYENPPPEPFGWVALIEGETIPLNYYTRKSWAWRGV